MPVTLQDDDPLVKVLDARADIRKSFGFPVHTGPITQDEAMLAFAKAQKSLGLTPEMTWPPRKLHHNRPTK
jgi:hypothetical protein